MRSVVVVAKYNEDCTWVTRLPPHVDPLVVVKGEHLPNEGREAGSYIWAFKTLLETGVEDSDLIYCVQGDPFVHCPNLVPEMYKTLRGEVPTLFLPLGNWVVECDGMGGPHHRGLPVAQKYEEWFDKEFPGSISFTAGGQFCVTGKDLKEKDWDSWYERAKEEHGPWLMERFWKVIFSD